MDLGSHQLRAEHRLVEVQLPVELGHAAPSPSPHESRRPLVITGATGTLGRAFGRICEQRGIEHRLLSRNELDIADPRAPKSGDADYGNEGSVVMVFAR